MNAWVGHLLPAGCPSRGSCGPSWSCPSIFLVPATVLGMVGPVVAKMAVEQARKAGSAIGDVYFWGAVGSIIGTFFCGFVLTYLAPSSIIVLLIAAALAALAGTLMKDNKGLALGLSAGVLLLIGSIFSMLGNPGLGAVDLGSYQINYVALAGNLAGCRLGILGLVRLLERPPRRAGQPWQEGSSKAAPRRSNLKHPVPAWLTWRCWRSSPAWCSCRSRWSPAGWSSDTWARASTAGRA